MPFIAIIILGVLGTIFFILSIYLGFADYSKHEDAITVFGLLGVAMILAAIWTYVNSTVLWIIVAVLVVLVIWFGMLDAEKYTKLIGTTALTAIILAVILIFGFFDESSSRSSYSDKDLNDYRSWDYDGDGKLDDKERSDYLKFKQDMEKARN